MLVNYLKITFRNLLKNKLFVIINILGLGTSLAICITAYLNWNYDVQFDAQHVNAREIYRINFMRITNGEAIKNGSCPMPLGDAIKGSIAQVDEVIRVNPSRGNFKVGDELFQTRVMMVDPNFFDIFSFNIIYGDKSNINDKTRIIISTDISKKHFGDMENPVGQLMTYIDGDYRREFIVGGVFERPPQNNSFRARVFIHFDNVFDMEGASEDNWAHFNTTFVTVKNPLDIPAVEEQLQQYVEIQNRAKEDYKVAEYYLDPFKGMAVRAQRERIWNHWLNYSLPTSAAIGPGVMAILILLLACFNFTNTSIAIANRRIKEIGIRKVLGSTKPQLIAQFLGENILITLFSLMVGVGMAFFMVPYYSQMWTFLQIELDFIKHPELWIFLVSLLVFTGVIAGSYPAFYVSGFQPTSILRGTFKFGGTNFFTRTLLTLQFSIAMVSIVTGFIFAQNAKYQNDYDLGFDTESVVYAYVNNENRFKQMKNELAGYSHINEITGSRHNATASWYTDPIKFESTELDVDILDIGDGYLSTIGATITAGRDFIKDSQNDVENSVIVNEELVRTFDWENPIGQRIVLRDTLELFVVGVVKDIYLQGGLWNPLKPMLMRYVLEDGYQFLSVKADVSNITQVHELMEEKWKLLFPDELPRVGYMEEGKVESANINKNITVMNIFMGLIACILSAIGLFSLVSLNLIKRVKEIGVRKVFGASLPHLVRRLSREFLIILLIASILGAIGGYFMSEMIMGSIWIYYLPIGPLPFILSIILLFIISGITITGKVIKAASMNPALTLRDE
ncbi:FtsX-like permease family protein [Bacteroidota bacterium]